MEMYARSVKICIWCKSKAYVAVRKSARYLWVFAAISIVTIVPLIFEVEREVQVLELEELQVRRRRARNAPHPHRRNHGAHAAQIKKLQAEGKPREQIAEMGLVGTSGSITQPNAGLKDRI